MVGEIHDEFDVVERPLTLADGAVVFDAALNVRDLETQYNITIPEDPAYATVGGFVLDQLGFIPKGGESFDFGNSRFTVVEMDGKRVARVKIQLHRTISAENKIAESKATGDSHAVAKVPANANPAGNTKRSTNQDHSPSDNHSSENHATDNHVGENRTSENHRSENKAGSEKNDPESTGVRS